MRSQRVDVVLTSTDGDQALELLEDRTERGKAPPDVIFLDLRLPRMDGFEFLMEFEARYPESATRIVIVTGSMSDPDRLRALSHEAVIDCVAKPVFQRDFERLFRPKSFIPGRYVPPATARGAG